MSRINSRVKYYATTTEARAILQQYYNQTTTFRVGYSMSLKSMVSKIFSNQFASMNNVRYKGLTIDVACLS